MEITLIAVCRNEANTGHIDSFLKWNVPLFDNVLIYDDASTDDTVNLLKQSGVEVMENEISIFKNELLIREKILAEAKFRYPTTAWFMILDLDEVLTCSREELITIIEIAENQNCTGVSFKLVNLWKSEVYFRTDEYFDKVAKTHLWKNQRDMYFSGESGLHRELHPISIQSIYAQDSIRILHLGFSTREKIVQKFVTYKNFGQESRSLWRLIDERYLETQPLSSIASSLGQNANEWMIQANFDQPIATSIAHYLSQVHELDAMKVGLVRKPFVTLVCLIYSGVDWLEFAYGELLLLQREFEHGEVEILFCANDASQEVLDYLKYNGIPHIEFNNADPKEHYISRVYRAYNFATRAAKSEYCLLVNSDMAYTPGFLTKILFERDKDTFVVARLIESGTLKPGPLAVKKNFGKSLQRFRRKAFYKYALCKEEPGVAEGGLFMPLLVSREVFLKLGGFPEGNITPGSLDSYIQGEYFEIAKPGTSCVSGDEALFKKAKLNGIKHVTSLRSIAYHFQEGEKRHTSAKVNAKIRSGFAIAHDSGGDTSNESVLWKFLVEILEKNGLQVNEWNLGNVRFPWVLLRKLIVLNSAPKVYPRVRLQNASYPPNLDKGARFVALLQDNLIDHTRAKMREKVLRNASTVVTNSIAMINLDAENHFVWQTFPTSELSIQADPTFTNNFGYFGNALDEAFAEAVAINKLNIYPRINQLSMTVTNSILEEEWKNLLIKELRKSFYPDLDESRTIFERIMRKLHSPKLVSDYA